MGFGKMKVRTKIRSGRGSADAEATVEALAENWKAMEDAIASLTQAEKDELKAHFNDFEGEGDLGDILFGRGDDFVSRVKFLDGEV